MYPMAIVTIMNQFFYIISMLVWFVQPSLSHTSSFSTEGSQETSPVTVMLLTAQTALGSQKHLKMGLEFKLKPGWKIYAPSLDDDSSFSAAPQVTEEQSINVEKFDLLWPPSQTYTLEGFPYQAYEDHVILPIRVDVVDLHKPMTLNLSLNYSVCSTTCVPVRNYVTYTLQPGVSHRTSDAMRIEAYETAKSALSMRNKVAANSEVVSYPWMLLFAFIGGVVLNFMPCVLPVLSLKIISFAKTPPQRPGVKASNFRTRFIATFLGVMFSFLLLGAMAAGLSHMGVTVGWGSHFQQPLFLVFLIVITTLFSNSLWGFIDIELPYFIRQGLNKLLSRDHKHNDILIEDFTAGMLATLLATPCTAPFLGTALGYALAQSSLEIVLFFTVMGLGFSMPYWTGALLPPGWIRTPKPGRWMIVLSQTLGWVLALTTLWLLWIVSQLLPRFAVVILGVSVVILSLIFKASRLRPKLKKINWIVSGCMLLVPVLSTTAPLVSLNSSSASNLSRWQNFDPDQIPSLVQQGHTVVVNITAAWCLTCHLNKYMVFESQESIKLLSHKNIIQMQADWTHRDTKIAQYLLRYHRGGIPFNIVLGPGAPGGIVLPEILTFKDLSAAIQKAQEL